MTVNPTGRPTTVAGLPSELTGLAFGADYNPEQWDEATWDADVALMREAGVNLVSVGIFAWAQLEPRPGEFDFGWLDRVIDLLCGGGIAVDLATPTVVPPAWFYREHPEAWVVDRDGRRLGPGSRGICCPSSPAYADAAARITTALAERYASHPAVVMWHVHNEYGAPVFECHCDQSQVAFREWLLARYGDLDQLNSAWGATFWGQIYGDIDEVAHTGGDRFGGQPSPPVGLPPLLRRGAAAVFPARTRHHRGLHRPPGDHQLHGHHLPGDRPVALAGRGRHRRQRPLPHRRARGSPHPARDGCRPQSLTRRRPPLAADGALDLCGELAAAQHRQTARRDDPQHHGAHRPRCRWSPVLPMAGEPQRCREIPFRHAAPRRHRQRDVARVGRYRRL